jgi:hypothetical protein
MKGTEVNSQKQQQTIGFFKRHRVGFSRDTGDLLRAASEIEEKPCAYRPIVPPTSSSHQPDKDNSGTGGRQPR